MYLTELIIDLNTITEDEKKGNPEYFPGTSAKTPERYMKVRNAILDCWRKNPTVYLSKQACRKEHTGLGCVNALGRIHSYLERVNAINVGFPAKPPRNVGTRSSASKGAQPKRKSSPSRFYNDFSEDDTDFVSYNAAANGTSRRSTRKKVKNYNEQYDNDTSPFSLVEPSFFTNSNPAPFKVICDPSILAICDFHSHLCWTEVIGLLGGKYDQESSTLTILSVFPCNGMSSDIECEMDPASEMEARECFASLGLSVVGWYHSHPTFCSNPSMRDIETQFSYQTLFKLEDSVEPFIGLIISPFEDCGPTKMNSTIQALTMYPFGSDVDFRLPFLCDLETVQSQDVNSKNHIFEELIKRYSDHERKVALKEIWNKKSNITYYDKMISSVQSRFEGMEQNLGDLKTVLDGILLLTSGQN